jgi:hypothetical protein
MTMAVAHQAAQATCRLGNFPNLAALGTAGLLHNDHNELTFETGLNWLLTGIAAERQEASP